MTPEHVATTQAALRVKRQFPCRVSSYSKFFKQTRYYFASEDKIKLTNTNEPVQ